MKTAAFTPPFYWVAFGGLSCSVMSTTCLIFSAGSGLRRGGRVASLMSPSTPFGRIAATPAADRQHALADRHRNRHRRQAVARQPHDPRPPNHLLRRVAVLDKLVQSLTISCADQNSLDLPHRRRLAGPRPFVNCLSVTEH